MFFCRHFRGGSSRGDKPQSMQMSKNEFSKSVTKTLVLSYITIIIINCSSAATNEKNGLFACPTSCDCLRTTVRCTHSQLGQIPPVLHPNTTELDLRFNEIKSVSSKSISSLNNLRILRLDSNPIVCDCHLEWLVKSLKNVNFRTRIVATCQSPPHLTGKSLTSLTGHDLLCEGSPRITKGPSDTVVTSGQTAYFTCTVEGHPAPQVYWLHNNETMRDEPRIQLLDNGSTLVIEETHNQDVGFYECTAENKMGSAHSRRAQMMLVNDEPSSAQHLEEPILATAPRILWVTSNETVIAGSHVEFNCHAVGHPRPKIKWFRNDTLITPGPRIKETEDGKLMMELVKPKDSGSYRCLASNSMGRDEVTVSVRVLGLPRFTVKPRDVYTSKGGTAVFPCEVVGDPHPVLSWFKDGVPVRPSRRYNVFIGGTRMRILGAKLMDEGDYTCRAENTAGVIEAEASLYVRAKLAPVIKNKPKDVLVNIGGVAELCCHVQGLPPPTVTWRRDGVRLTSDDRIKVALNGSLLILKTTAVDEGTYECTAENYVGYDTAMATLKIKAEPKVYIGDEFLELSFEEAQTRVQKAYNNTINHLFIRNRRKPVDHRELLRIFRYPRYEGRNIARVSETIEQTLGIVERHVLDGMKFTNLSEFKYEDLLSPRKLRVLSQLSGCLVHRRPVTSCHDDLCFHMRYRTLDGSCNNFNHPMWGASLTGFKRNLPPIYENGFNTPVGWSKTKKYFGFFKPSARTVSTRLLTSTVTSPDRHCTHMLMQWGQFMDHDIDHALPAISTESFKTGEPCHQSCTYSPPCFPIKIPTDDPRIRHRCMEFTRSSAVCGSGASSVLFDRVYPREQINQLTSFIDASQIYTSSDLELQDLRNLSYPYGELRRGISTGDGGKPLLPFSNGSPIDCRRNFTESAIDCFLAGDVRANEQVGLISMHTIWLREHNRLVRELRLLNPQWNGDTLFHEARKIIGAVMQHITFYQWLPHILGPKMMAKLGPYPGYDPQINPAISNVFATAALRFGHTMINPDFKRLNSTFQSIPEGPLPLHKAFFSPWRVVEEGGVDPILRGLIVTPAKLKNSGQLMNSDLTEKLFHSAHEIALDLAAMNIQRGRDHALPGYAKWRKFCNLTVPESFEDLKSDIPSKKIRLQLRQLYGHPGNIDLFVGGVLEEVVEGGRVGPTLACLLARQFQELRVGDRFWYENPSVFKPQQLTEISQATLGKVLCDNGDAITDITKDVFILPQKQKPSFIPCSDVPRVNLMMWAECCEVCGSFESFSEFGIPPPIRRVKREEKRRGFTTTRVERTMKNSSIVNFVQNVAGTEDREIIVEATPSGQDIGMNLTFVDTMKKRGEKIRRTKRTRPTTTTTDRIDQLESTMNTLLDTIERLNEKIKKLEFSLKN